MELTTDLSLESSTIKDSPEEVEIVDKDWSAVIKDWYLYIIFMDYILLVFGIPGNILTVLAFVKYPSIRTPTNYLICNQSVADLMACFVCQVWVFFNYTAAGMEFASNDKYACLVGLSGVVITLLTSAYNLLALSTERLIAVLFSYQYVNWVTERSVRNAIIVLWAAILFVCTLPLMGWNVWQPGRRCLTFIAYNPVYFKYFNLTPMFFAVVMTTIFNIIICTIAATKKKFLPAPKVAPQSEAEVKKRASDDNKITKMFLMVVGVFYLSWLPYISCTITTFVPPATWKIYGPPKWFLVIYEVAKGTVVFNGLLNPMIYAWKNAPFRNAFRKLLRLKRKGLDEFGTSHTGTSHTGTSHTGTG